MLSTQLAAEITFSSLTVRNCVWVLIQCGYECIETLQMHKQDVKFKAHLSGNKQRQQHRTGAV